MKKIVLPYGEITAMAEKHGYTVQFVSNVLNFKKDSRKARALRRIAVLEHGGQPIGITREDVVDYDKFTRDNIETQKSVSL